MRRHHKENLDNYILEEDFQTFLADIFQLLLLSTLFTMKGPHGVLNTGTSLTPQRETAATLHHLNKDEKPYCTLGKKNMLEPYYKFGVKQELKAGMQLF